MRVLGTNPGPSVRATYALNHWTVSSDLKSHFSLTRQSKSKLAMGIIKLIAPVHGEVGDVRYYPSNFSCSLTRYSSSPRLPWQCVLENQVTKLPVFCSDSHSFLVWSDLCRRILKGTVQFKQHCLCWKSSMFSQLTPQSNYNYWPLKHKSLNLEQSFDKGLSISNSLKIALATK